LKEGEGQQSGNQRSDQHHSQRAAFARGARDAAASLAAGYLAFGALAAGNGLPFAGALLSTLAIWALPGQLILVEMHAAGATFYAIVLSVALSAARFLPMTMVFMPLARHARNRGWHYYAAAQLLALTGWSLAMARFPSLAPERRLAWFFGATITLCLSSAAATVVGYAVAAQLPPLVQLGLVFLAPMYFLLNMLSGARDRLVALSIVAGSAVGPLVHLVSPDWSLLAGGIGGGTLAWALARRFPRSARGG
jgi:predicted branched-subunit amino acid permease